MIKIRRFKIADAKATSKLIKNALLKVNSKDYDIKLIRSMCKHFSPKTIIENAKVRIVYVGVLEDKIIGTASIVKNIILTVFVDPKYHGKGIGAKLMQTVEKSAKKKGYKLVKVPSSITAYNFYKKLGYKKVKEVYHKDAGKNIIMKKRI